MPDSLLQSVVGWLGLGDPQQVQASQYGNGVDIELLAEKFPRLLQTVRTLQPPPIQRPTMPAEPRMAASHLQPADLPPASTIGPARVGTHYTPPTLNEMIARPEQPWRGVLENVMGAAVPPSVRAQDPLGIQAFEQGGPLPGFAFGTLAPEAAGSRVLAAAEAAEHLARAPTERVGGRLLVSTRVPGGVRPPVATGGSLMTGVADIAQDPTLLKKIADKLRTDPMLRERERTLSDADVLKVFGERAAQNIDALIAMQPLDVRERAAQWYPGGHRLANEFAAEVGVTGDQGAAVLASQSPSKEWHQNVDLGRRIMRRWREFGQTDPALTREVADHHMRTTTQSAEEWIHTNHLTGEKADQARARATKKITAMNERVGQRWSDLPLAQQARMVRAVDELTTPQTYPIWSPEGRIANPLAMTGGKNPKPRTLVWQSYANIENALSILHDGSDANISMRVGEGHKVRSFFNDINVPTDPRSVTVDTHNIGGAHFRPMGGSAPEVKAVMAGPGSAPTGIYGAHGVYRDAVTEAARAHELLPSAAQSVSWESIKGLFSPAQRRDEKFVAAVRSIWEEYNRGRIRLEEVHARIYDLAGGLAPPEWATPK